MRTIVTGVWFAVPLLVGGLWLSGSVRAQGPDLPVEPALARVGDRLFVWREDFQVKIEGKDPGNTHGCLVVRQNGNVLANTDTEHAVVEFAPDGKVVRTWGAEFRGGLHGMCLRVEGGKEVLYLAHTRRHEVLKTTIDGEVLWTLGWPQQSGVYDDEGQYNPTAVAVAPDGRIFAADGYGKYWVHIYDEDRTYVKSFGGFGTEPGKMHTPHGLWLDARGEQPLLLVCDRENHRLQWFDLDGNFVRLMDQDLRRPCNVWPTPEGGLVVADLRGRITFLDADDKLLAHVGDNPEEKLRAQNRVPPEQWRAGEFLSPHSVCVDRDGSVYVMDWNYLGRITKLTSRKVVLKEQRKQ